MIYLVDNVIHLLNNRGQYGTTKALSTLISVLFELTDIFFRFVLATVQTYVFGENCQRKCIFSKTFSRVWIFEKAGFSFTCGRTKTEVFQYDDVIHHVLLAWRMLRKGCFRLSFVLAFSCGWPKTIRVHQVLMGSFFCFFSLKRGKRSPFSKKPGCVCTGPKIQIFFFVVLSWHKCYDFSFIHPTSSLECKKQKHYCLPKIHPQQWAKFDKLLTHSALRTDVVPLTKRNLQHFLANR